MGDDLIAIKENGKTGVIEDKNQLLSTLSLC